MLSKELYRTYVQILKDELVPAMGCTEPIAIAYAGAVARKTLGVLPDRVEVAVSREHITALQPGLTIEELELLLS